jgi:hypothetical protein
VEEGEAEVVDWAAAKGSVEEVVVEAVDSGAEGSDAVVDSAVEDSGVEESEAEAVDSEAVAEAVAEASIAEGNRQVEEHAGEAREVGEVGITAEQLYKYAVLETSIPPVLDHCSNPHVRPKICTMKAYRVRNVSSLVAPRQYGC